ncbi:hypothetical protein HAX54_016737 [Datura stramonium]|uniref:Uncharacterized protein n=1 Tax=Datura stramonium TaxID=4076 RepID=A0ABS8UJH5_DATST|nr:hypothetical protein [Datura stramonium]
MLAIHVHHLPQVVSEVRLPEVGELKHVWWLEIRGTIRAGVLSPRTSYAAYLVYKLEHEFGFHYRPSELSVGFIGVELNKRFAFLVPEGGLQRRNGYEESIYTLPMM